MNNSLAPTRPLCILHSGDVELRHRLAAALQERAYVCHAPDEQRLEELLGGAEPLLLFVDLRLPTTVELVPRLGRLYPHVVGIGLGHQDSDPFIAAQDAGLYRVENFEMSRPALRTLIDHAIERVGWMQETQMLRDELARMRTLHQSGNGSGGRGGGANTRNPQGVQNLVKATRNLDRLEDLFEKIIDGVASAALVSRAGIFYRSENEAVYRLRAGRCCLDDTEGMEFSERDPLVRWLQRHPRLITRASLDHIHDPAERSLLRRSLDLFGAETFIPLNLRGKVLGWLFTGQTDGLPFDHHDHPELSFLSEHVVHALENTLKHHELVVQKHLGDNILQMMPTAVVTVDADGHVTWSNAPAERLFPALARDLARHAGSSGPAKPAARIPVEDLGSRLAGLLRGALAGEAAQEPFVWESQAAGGRILTIRTRLLQTGSGKCMGAVALLDDITDQLHAKAQREHLERASFWRELAAGISHEIRNPLVAIKTMAHLLPQRHADESFRLEFKELVMREVDRLDGIVGEIETFAHPEATDLVDGVNLPAVLQAAVEVARAAHPAPDAQFKISADEDVPVIRGNIKALTQAFHHLFVNALEAAAGKKVRPQVKIRVIPQRAGTKMTGVKLAIVDNGPGIPAGMHERVFSPFCTTKARGLGLGLPLAQRVFLDHGGSVELDHGTMGLCVNITLPLEPPSSAEGSHQLVPGKAAAQLQDAAKTRAEDYNLPYTARKRLS